MDYAELLNQLRQASLFDLYRLFVAIDRELENPQRIRVVKQKLRLGMELHCFDRVQKVVSVANNLSGSFFSN